MDNDGSIKCLPCDVVVDDVMTLIHHQMQPIHFASLKDKNLAHVVPRIVYCTVSFHFISFSGFQANAALQFKDSVT